MKRYNQDQMIDTLTKINDYFSHINNKDLLLFEFDIIVIFKRLCIHQSLKKIGFKEMGISDNNSFIERFNYEV